MDILDKVQISVAKSPVRTNNEHPGATYVSCCETPTSEG